MTYRGPWNAAGTRHRQTPRRYKRVAPVGEHQPIGQVGQCFLWNPETGEQSARTCQFCGYHVCSCEKLVPKSSHVIGNIELSASFQAAAKQTFERIMGAQKREMSATLEGIGDQIIAEAHRASMQPQGGTAASTCNHSGIGLLGCEVCDPLAKVRQASERASGRSK